MPGKLGTTDRATWLDNATTVYVIHDFRFDDVVARRYGDTVVVSSLYTQKATVNGRDRSGEAFLTDVWVREGGAWKVAARYSSSPKAAAKPVAAPGSAQPPDSSRR
jgi:hypothetical protein